MAAVARFPVEPSAREVDTALLCLTKADQNYQLLHSGFGSRVHKGRARSNAIDRQIEKEIKNCQLLLLGSDPERSMLVKQMKIHRGLAKDELLRYRLCIYQNSLNGAQALVRAIHNMGIEYDDPTNHVAANRIMDYHIQHSPSFVFSPEIAMAIHNVWQDPIMPQVMNRRNEFYLDDSAEYFFEEILRIGSLGYLPTDNDILRARPQIIQVVETHFTFGALQATIVDPGRSCSPKRIRCFEDVAYVIFCASLDDYDQVLHGDGHQNQLNASILLFEAIVNSRRFARTSFILLLTNTDAFENKLSKVPLERYFPDYTGGADVIKATAYIRWRFMRVKRLAMPNMFVTTHIVYHRSINTTTESIHVILKNSILEDAWKNFRRAPSCSAALQVLRLRRMFFPHKLQRSHFLGMFKTIVQRPKLPRSTKHLSTPGIVNVIKEVYDCAKDNLMPH